MYTSASRRSRSPPWLVETRRRWSRDAREIVRRIWSALVVSMSIYAWQWQTLKSDAMDKSLHRR